MLNIFTDDDLKLLKEVIQFDSEHSHWVGRCIASNEHKVAGLIARLEAAEKAMMACQNDYCCNTPEYEAWRKAAGR